MSLFSAIANNPLTNSPQYLYFRSLNGISQLIIIADAVGGGTTFYTTSNAFIPLLGLTIPLTILGSIGFGKSSYKLEGKKAVRIENSKFYEKTIANWKNIIENLESDSNHMLELATEETNKSFGIAVKKERAKVIDSDLEAYLEKVKRENKHLKGIALDRKIQTATRVYARTKASKVLRNEAEQSAYVAKMDKIDALRDQIHPIQAEEAGLSTTIIANVSKKDSESQFAKRFDTIFETSVGGGVGFIKAGSFLYVILSNALNSDYTSPAVIVPCIIMGLVASIFAAKGRYNDHQAEEQEKLQFANFKKQNELFNKKYEKIKEVNAEIKKLAFNVEEVKSSAPTNAQNEEAAPPAETLPAQRRFSILKLVSGLMPDFSPPEQKPKTKPLLAITVDNLTSTAGTNEGIPTALPHSPPTTSSIGPKFTEKQSNSSSSLALISAKPSDNSLQPLGSIPGSVSPKESEKSDGKALTTPRKPGSSPRRSSLQGASGAKTKQDKSKSLK
jgi:hypothetical protein